MTSGEEKKRCKIKNDSTVSLLGIFTLLSQTLVNHVLHSCPSKNAPCRNTTPITKPRPSSAREDADLRWREVDFLPESQRQRSFMTERINPNSNQREYCTLELFGLTAKKTSPRTDTSYVMSSAFSSVVAKNVLILWTIRFERSILGEYIYQDAQWFPDDCLSFFWFQTS